MEENSLALEFSLSRHECISRSLVEGGKRFRCSLNPPCSKKPPTDPEAEPEG
jgi:hypothetical protein